MPPSHRLPWNQHRLSARSFQVGLRFTWRPRQVTWTQWKSYSRLVLTQRSEMKKVKRQKQLDTCNQIQILFSIFRGKTRTFTAKPRPEPHHQSQNLVTETRILKAAVVTFQAELQCTGQLTEASWALFRCWRSATAISSLPWTMTTPQPSTWRPPTGTSGSLSGW